MTSRFSEVKIGVTTGVFVVPSCSPSPSEAGEDLLPPTPPSPHRLRGLWLVRRWSAWTAATDAPTQPA
nr:MAG TPA_asm: hypothetical protein [Caudoviricetes sp.]